MAKRNDKPPIDDKLRRAIIRNWIICGVSLAACLILYMLTRA